MKSKNIIQEYVTQRILPEEEYTTNEEYYFKDGVKTLKDGHWEYLYDDGTLCAKGTFMRGIPVGAWQKFHTNGQLSQRGFYDMTGCRVSKYEYGDTWEYYDKDGNKEHLFDVGYDAQRDETSQQFYDSLGSDFLEALDDFEDDD